MRKRKGILGKIIIGAVALAVIGSVFGDKDDSNTIKQSGQSVAAVEAKAEIAESAASPEPAAEEAAQQAETIKEDTAQQAEPVKEEAAQQQAEPVKEETAQQAEIEKEEPASEQAEAPADNTSGIRPELKEFLESYEAFMDEYCEFMQSYESSDLAQLTKYTQLLSKYTDFVQKADAWEGEDMNNEELLYYTEVLNRVSQKLLKAGL